jgi:choline kinase
MHDLSIIIPAAGLGRRMKSYGPKALIDVGNKQSLIGRQLTILRELFPKAEFIVVVGHQADKICSRVDGVRIVQNLYYDTTNVARSIGIGLHYATRKTALVVYGDLVFNRATFKNIPLTSSCVVVDQPDEDGFCQLRDNEVGCNVVDGVVTHFDYGLDTKWAQIVLLAGKELSIFKKLSIDPAKRRYFGFEILNAILEQEGNFNAHEPADMRIVEVDSSRDIVPARLVPA